MALCHMRSHNVTCHPTQVNTPQWRRNEINIAGARRATGSLSRGEGVSLGVNLLKIVGGRSSVDDTAMEAPRRQEWRLERGYTPLQWGGVWGPRKNLVFVLRNVELLCILDSGAGR